MNVDQLVSSLGCRAVSRFVAAERPGVSLPGETALIAVVAQAGQARRPPARVPKRATSVTPP